MIVNNTSTKIKSFDEFSSIIFAQLSRFRDFWFMNFYFKNCKFFSSMKQIFFHFFFAFTQLRKVTFNNIFLWETPSRPLTTLTLTMIFSYWMCTMKFNWIKGKQSQKNIDSFVHDSDQFVFWERKPREEQVWKRKWYGMSEREKERGEKMCVKSTIGWDTD